MIFKTGKTISICTIRVKFKEDNAQDVSSQNINAIHCKVDLLECDWGAKHKMTQQKMRERVYDFFVYTLVEQQRGLGETTVSINL